jgi:SAM-dependent methyltransferase
LTNPLNSHNGTTRSTKIIQGTTDVIAAEVAFFSNTRKKPDTYMKYTRPPLAVGLGQIKKAFLDAKNRVHLRYLTEIAKERAASLGLQDIIEFKESDAEVLDLPDSAYDAVLCRWGLMLLPNVDAALSKIHGSLVSGGRFAAAVWADAPKVPIISLASRIISEQLRMPPSPPRVPNPFSLADIKKLENHLVKAGFSDLHIETVNVTFEFASGEDYSQYCQAVSAQARMALSKETKERRGYIWKKVAEEAARNYEPVNGLIRMDNESICVAATRSR